MKAVIYARRSQQHQDASVRTQIDEATRFIESKGWTLVGIYADDDKNTSRREFVKRRRFLDLLADAEEGGRFEVVVARDHTRLGGDTSRTMRAIEDLTDAGVAVFYYIGNKQVRLDDWRDKIMFAVESGTAEAERDGISSRTYEALMVRARSGWNAGGKVYGYDNVPVLEGSVKKRTEYRINEEQAAVVRDIFEMYAEGRGLKAIAVELNARRILSPSAGKRGIGLWSPSALHSIIRNERYRGVITYGKTRKTYKKGTKIRVKRPESEWMRADGSALRIVPEKLWQKVAQRIASYQYKPWVRAPGPKPKHLLAGLAVCGACGGRIKAQRVKHGSEYVKAYICARWHELNACTNKLKRPIDEIERDLLEEVQARVLDEHFIAAVLREARRRLVERVKRVDAEDGPNLRAEMQKLRGEIANLAEAVATGGASIPALVQKLKERQERVAALEARLAALLTAPRALQTEVKRIEADVQGALGELRKVFAEQPADWRRFLENFLDGKLTLTPVKTWKGNRYRIDGRATLGGLVSLPNDPYLLRPQRESNPR
jgi:site-specific DNA recombinase